MSEQKCIGCTRSFTPRVIEIGGRHVITAKLCDKCAETSEAEYIKSREQQALEVRNNVWAGICPPLYQETDIKRLSLPKQTIAKVLAWNPNPTGLALAGETGIGKTRLMFQLLHKVFFAGTPVKAITAKKFEYWCARMFDKDDDARDQIDRCHKTRVLFIDDLGKEKLTERVESEFYNLIEHRTSHKLPILFTTNRSSSEMSASMSSDRGEPIIRRLKEFTEIIAN